MKKLVSILVLAAMLLASVIAIVPASAANETEIINFLPEGVYDKIKSEFEADGASTADYVPSVTPFVYTNYALNERIAGSKVLSITIPVKTTKALDVDGNFIFTLVVIKAEELNTGAAPVKTHTIKINAQANGLEANKTGVYKFVKVDLSSYDVLVAEDELLTFAGPNDTILPGWAQGDGSDVQKVFKENCAEYVGFAANAGKANYSANTNSSIFFDMELEKKVGWDEKEDVSADDLDFTNYETRRLWTDEIYAGIKALYEKDGANTLDWVPGVAPFAPVNVKFQNRMAGTRLRSITLPVNKTLAADNEGNFIFTIHTFKRAELAGSSPVQSWKIKINGEKYGLAANKSGIYKFVENIDLTSYDIRIAEDEVLAFFSSSDTFLPGYSGNASAYFTSNFPEMMGFGANAGKVTFPKDTYTGAVIFYDLTYDIPVSETYAKVKALVDTVKDYDKDDFSAGFDTFKTALEAAQAKLDSADSTGDFTAEYTALDSAVKALVAITEIDKTALAAAITAASAYENKASEYTADSYTVFTDALAAAKSVNADEDAKQSAVNNAQKALDDAVKALDKKGDISTLSAKVQSIQKDYDRDDYTAVSYKPLNDALRKAEDLISANSESFNAIESLIKEIDAAVAGLKRRADFTALNELVTKYEGVSHTEYTKESVDALLAVIDKVKEKRKPAVSPNVSEEEAAALLDELKAAIDGLVPYAVYDGINERIAEVEAMDKSKYTEESWNKVKAAIDAIDDLRSDRYTTQPAADAALKALNDAVAALVLVGSEGADKGNNGEGNSTDAPTTNDTNKATEPEEKGCGGVIATTAVVMTSVLALGAAIVAKKEEN